MLFQRSPQRQRAFSLLEKMFLSFLFAYSSLLVIPIAQAQVTDGTVCCLCTKSGAGNLCFTPPTAGSGVGSDGSSLCGHYAQSPDYDTLSDAAKTTLHDYVCLPGNATQCVQHSSEHASGMCPSDTIASMADAASPTPAAPPAAAPSVSTACCLCTKSGASNVCFTPPPAGPGVASDATSLCGNYNTSPLFVGPTLQAALAGYACTPGTSDQCAQHSATQASGMCPSNTIPDITNAASPPAAANTTPTSGDSTSPASPPPPFHSLTPSVSVTVPGLHFGSAHVEGDQVVIPFLSDYIKAWYNYLILIASLVAVVAIIYGGFLYLVGGVAGESKQGLEIIKNSVIGVVLVMGAYVTLHTINPATLNLDALRMPTINTVDLIDGELNAATGTTIGPSDATGSGGGGGGGGPSAAGGTAPPSFSSCPLQLQSPPAIIPFSHIPGTLGLRRGEALDIITPNRGDPRSIEFAQLAQNAYASNGFSQCVGLAGTAAAACGVHLGSCNAAALSITHICGVSHSTDLMHAFGADDMNFFRSRVCPGAWDTSCSVAAMTAVFQRLQSEMPGYPVNQISQLQAGDRIYIFNGNSGDRYGFHSQLFLGWDVPNVHAYVLNGQWDRVVWRSETCLNIGTGCAHAAPIIRIVHQS